MDILLNQRNRTAAHLKELMHPGTVKAPDTIKRGGSDRSFHRVSNGEKSVILCLAGNKDELNYYIVFNEFFASRGIPVPRILFSSLKEGSMIMEDAGPISLYEKVRSAESPGEILELYRKATEELYRLQRIDPAGCPALMERPFDYATLRWETSYFREHFLGTLMKREHTHDEELEKEFHILAGEVASFPRYTMHRDFQSQNIHVLGGAYYFLDIQGARTGPFLYDAASLIRDPYVNLPEELQKQIFSAYFAMLSGDGFFTRGYDEFYRQFLLVSLQRLMQALGAYGFLGIVKEKASFLPHVTPGLVQLERALRDTDLFPRLKGIVAEVMEDRCACRVTGEL